MRTTVEDDQSYRPTVVAESSVEEDYNAQGNFRESVESKEKMTLTTKTDEIKTEHLIGV